MRPLFASSAVGLILSMAASSNVGVILSMAASSSVGLILSMVFRYVVAKSRRMMGTSCRVHMTSFMYIGKAGSLNVKPR